MKRKVDVKFVGNRAISAKDLRDQLTIFTAGAFDDVELAESARALQREYQKHGYFEARVTFRRALRRSPVDATTGKPKGDDIEEVTFTIDEGPELKVQRVDIVSESGAPLRPSPPPTCATKRASRPSRFPRSAPSASAKAATSRRCSCSRTPSAWPALYKQRGFPAVKVRYEVARDPAAFDALGEFGAEVSGAGGGHDLIRALLRRRRAARDRRPRSRLSFVGPHVEERARRPDRRCSWAPAASSPRAPSNKTSIASSTCTRRKAARSPASTRRSRRGTRRTIASSSATSSTKARRCASARSSSAATSRRTHRRSAAICRSSPAISTTSPSSKRPSATCRRTSSSTPRACWRPCRSGRNVAPVLVVVQERYLEAYGALTFAVGAASDRLPDYAYVQATYLWSNFLGYGSQLELRGDFAWLAALLGNPITMGASFRYTDIRAFGPGWRYDLTASVRQEVTARFGVLFTLRRLDGPDAQHHAGAARLRARRPLPVADQRRLLARQRLQRHRVRCRTTRSRQDASSASLGIDAATPRARSIRWRRPRAGCCKASVGYAPPRRQHDAVPRAHRAGAGAVAVPRARHRLHAHRQPALRPRPARRTRRPCRSSSASTPAATRKCAATTPTRSRARSSAPRCRRCRATPASASFPRAATSASSTPSSFSSPSPRTSSGCRCSGRARCSGTWAWSSTAGTWRKPSDVKHSIGISLLRLVTPVGPLSIEYAYPLTQTLAEERWKTAPWYTPFSGAHPLQLGHPAVASMMSQGTSTASPAPMRPRVLVVDDEPNMCRSLAILVADEGRREVETARSGEEALHKLGDATDVVLCDLSMPGIDGIELLRRVRAARLDVQVIMMTAYSTVQSAVEAMRLGAHEYLIKPFTNEEVCARRRLGAHADAAEPLCAQAARRRRRSAGRDGRLVGADAAPLPRRRARRRSRRHRARHRRVGDGQGADGARHPHARQASRSRRSSPSTARRCRRSCSSRSCSATSAAPSPARTRPRSAGSSRPTAAPSSSTRSATCRRRCRPSSCARSRRAASSASAGWRRSTSICASIAATNQDLPRAIAEGRFREDLVSIA